MGGLDSASAKNIEGWDKTEALKNWCNELGAVVFESKHVVKDAESYLVDLLSRWFTSQELEGLKQLIEDEQMNKDVSETAKIINNTPESEKAALAGQKMIELKKKYSK